MKNTALALLSALLLSVAAFAETGGAWSKFEGQHSRISQPRTVAVFDQASWEKVWKEHSSDAPVPAVDFSKEGVVAVFLGVTRTGGVKIDVVVQEDMIDSSRLNVFYKEVRPASKSFATQMLCQPFAMVKVRKAEVVSFEVNGKASIPENLKAPKNPRDDTKFRALLETLPSFDGR